MKIDANYHAVLGFSRACGFKRDPALLLAYASQFVDDARINHIVIDGDPADIHHDIIDKEHSFFNMATCHSYSRVKTFNYSSMTGNTTPFHFVPGLKGDNFPKKLRCAEESPVITTIVNEALDDGNLIRFGLALHPYLDTFSHQGFSGILSKVNDIKNCRALSHIPGSLLNRLIKIFRYVSKNRFDRLLDSGVPAYGHGQAMDYPDLPFLRWYYEYDYSSEFREGYRSTGIIENSARYRRAFSRGKEYLSDYLNRHPEYRDNEIPFKDFTVLFDTLTSQDTDKGRIRRWIETIVKARLFQKGDLALPYDKDLWLKEAFKNYEKEEFNKRKVVGALLADNFSTSNWYQYYLAVRWYKDRFFAICKEQGLAIPR